jgi:hypothetical protein
MRQIGQPPGLFYHGTLRSLSDDAHTQVANSTGSPLNWWLASLSAMKSHDNHAQVVENYSKRDTRGRTNASVTVTTDAQTLIRTRIISGMTRPLYRPSFLTLPNRSYQETICRTLSRALACPNRSSTPISTKYALRVYPVELPYADYRVFIAQCTMQQAVLKHFPDVQATYRLTLRDKSHTFSQEAANTFQKAVSRESLARPSFQLWR